VGTIEGGAFVAIDSVTPAESNRWEDMRVWLKNYQGAGDQIAFRSANSVNYIDNIWMEIADTNACAFPPIGLEAVNVTSTSATLSWESSNDGETSYTLEWGLGDFVQGQGNSTIINNVADTFYQLTNLQPGEKYTFYVRANCGNALRTDFANANFLTECLYTIPFAEKF
jgi:hypothetical protein